MERYDYKKAVKEDIREYLTENWPKGKRIADDDLQRLQDDMFVADEVTGNGSGSYTFNSYEAEENVCHNLDLLGEALDEFCVDGDTLREKMDGEWADVTIRCYMLGQVLGEVVDEWNEKCDEEEEEEG